ncbi:MAG TPA: hypothetical protein DEH78_29090, partial [Solibacterales bacterium]|nr:hypothetical protein [Bryobacterales bacterium]
MWLAVALVTGLGAFGVSLGLAELSTKRAVLLTASLLAFVSALVSGRAKQIFLFAWVVALTYNRNYFFTAFDADSSYGPFWGPADIPLLLLMVHWWVQAAIWKQPSVRRGGAMWMWIAPFAAACVLSLPGALRPDWTFYELARVARFLLILFYFRRQVGRAEWMTILAAFGTSVLIQAVMGIVYVATGKQLGLALLFGSGVDERDMIQMAAEGGLGQMRRGSGTIGHPNTLAVYFMMLSPMFMALSVSKIAARWRVMSAVVALIATAGTGVTMSRTSWLIHSAQWVVMGLGLTAFKMITPRQLLGGAAILALVAVIAITPFLGKIQERLTGDFGDMLDFRAKHNGIALEIWQRSPFFGVGLNNYSDILARYPEDELAIFREFKDYFRKMLDV